MVLLATSITFMVSGTFLVGLRCYVRIFLLKGFGFDDMLIIVALVSLRNLV